MTKIEQQLKEAYEAGRRSLQFNKERDELLERGTKQCPAEANFENWLMIQDLDKKKSPTWNDFMKLAEQVSSEYSELRKLYKTSIGSAQLCDAMDNFHKKAKLLEE